MFNKTYNNRIYLLLSAMLILISCDKGLPKERYTVGLDSDVSVKQFSPVLGRNTVFTDVFFRGSTTFPSNFSIINMRRRSGDAAPELNDVFPVKIWKGVYTGDETSIQAIEAKREIGYRRLFEVGQASGEMYMWYPARSSFIRTLPDSGYVFDLQVENSGGRRIFKDLYLQPMKERPCEPSTLDPITGQSTRAYVNPNGGVKALGLVTQRNLSPSDIAVYIRKLQGNSANKITFRFLDINDQFIDPNKFNDTDWSNLVHGFNMVKTATGVTYDVAYPIPLVPVRTRYTTFDGQSANIMLRWKRPGFGGITENDFMGLQLKIFEEGTWEIVFKFLYDNPQFN